MAALQRQASESIPSLRTRRRERRRNLGVRRFLRLVLLLVVLLAVFVVAGDVWGVRTAAVDVVRHDLLDPARGR